MSNAEDGKYYNERRRAALAMSRAASEPSIRNIHREFATRYGELAEETAGLGEISVIQTATMGKLA